MHNQPCLCISLSLQLFDVLWSDPRPISGCHSNRLRGGGVYFGPDVTQGFFHKNGLTLLLRSHECKQDGYEVTHGGKVSKCACIISRLQYMITKVITVFSASNYYQHTSNKGAYVKLDCNLQPRFVQFINSNKDGHLKLSLRRRFIKDHTHTDIIDHNHVRMSAIEASAIQELREHIMSNRSKLLQQFEKHDPTGSGKD